MKQSFVVQGIILQRKKKIDYLNRILAKTTSPGTIVQLEAEIHNECNDLEIFTNSENYDE